MSAEKNVDQIIDYESDGDALMALSNRVWWTIAQDRVDAFQIRLLKQRFADLGERIPTLSKLIALQQVVKINTLDDVVPLLLQHSAYKSYPMTLLEKGKFKQLTQWLDKLTVHDLSQVDVADCRSIDDWFCALDVQTPLAINHSTGTTGKLSIIPRSKVEANRFATSSLKNFEGFGDEPNYAEKLLSGQQKINMIYPSYRGGRHAGNRMFRALVDRICSPKTSFALYEEDMSADVASLAGRVRTAEAKGDLDKLEIAPELLKKFNASVSLR
ncbi:MAG: hypothetical protein ABW049_07930, partial [Spongiibacteraceae bacterium]